MKIILFFIIFIIIVNLINKAKHVKYIFQKKIIKKFSSNFDRYKFENIYQQIINQVNVQELEKEQKSNFIYLFITACKSLLFFLFFIILFNSKISTFIVNNPLPSLFFIILFVLFLHFLDIIRTKLRSKESNSKYKELIIKKLISIINPQIEYITNYNNFEIANELYRNAFFEKIYPTAIVTDYMEYTFKSDTIIKLANIDIFQKDFTDDSNHINYIFNGIIAKIPKKNIIDDQILIKKINRLLNIKKSPNINSIITNKVDKNLFQLYKEYKIPFEISIFNDSMYVRFFTGPLFKSSYKSSFSSNKDKLYGDYVIFQTVLELMEKINELIEF